MTMGTMPRACGSIALMNFLKFEVLRRLWPPERGLAGDEKRGADRSVVRPVSATAEAAAAAALAGLSLAYIRAVALLVLHDAIDLDVLTAPARPEPKEEQ